MLDLYVSIATPAPTMFLNVYAAWVICAPLCDISIALVANFASISNASKLNASRARGAISDSFTSCLNAGINLYIITVRLNCSYGEMLYALSSVKASIPTMSCATRRKSISGLSLKILFKALLAAVNGLDVNRFPATA